MGAGLACFPPSCAEEALICVMENPAPCGPVTVGTSWRGSRPAGLGSRQLPGPALRSPPGKGTVPGTGERTLRRCARGVESRCGERGKEGDGFLVAVPCKPSGVMKGSLEPLLPISGLAVKVIVYSFNRQCLGRYFAPGTGLGLWQRPRQQRPWPHMGLSHGG